MKKPRITNLGLSQRKIKEINKIRMSLSKQEYQSNLKYKKMCTDSYNPAHHDFGCYPDNEKRLNVEMTLRRLLSGCSNQDIKLLELRHGLLDGKYYTLEEVGKIYGATRERVRQVEQRALERIRQRHPNEMKDNQLW